MNENKMNSAADYISKKLLKYEIQIIAIILSVLLIKFLNFPFSGTLNILVLGIIAIIYFLSSFRSFSQSDMTSTDLFFIKLFGVSSSISIIGILFSFQNYPGNMRMLFIGSISLIMVLIYILIQFRNQPEYKAFSKFQIYRIVFLLIISFSFVLNKI